MTNPGDSYDSSKSFSYILIALFGGIALCSAFYVAMSFLVIFVPDMAVKLENGRSLHLGYTLIATASSIEALLRLLTVVFFLIWEYRAFKNLTALKAYHTEFSPGWAIGWWFIPLANLIKPFQAIGELWNESDPEFDEDADFLHVSGGTPKIVGFWWAALLLSGITGSLADMLVNQQTGIISKDFPMVFIVSNVFRFTAAVLVLLIVKGITQRQEQRFGKIAAARHFAPPPPEFYRNS